MIAGIKVDTSYWPPDTDEENQEKKVEQFCKKNKLPFKKDDTYWCFTDSVCIPTGNSKHPKLEMFKDYNFHKSWFYLGIPLMGGLYLKGPLDKDPSNFNACNQILEEVKEILPKSEILKFEVNC